MEGDVDFLNRTNIDCEIEDATGKAQRAILTIEPQLSKALSSSKTGIVTTSFANNAIANGEGFNIESIFTIGAADHTYDIVFDTTAFTRNEFISYPSIFGTSAGPVIVTLGTCDSYTVGTAITPLNQNHNFKGAYPAEIIFKYDVTTTGYVATTKKKLVGSTSTNQDSGGGTLSGLLPIWLETGIIYVFRIDNLSGEEIYFYLNNDWFEI